MTHERAIEILDPEHREHYESIEPVNEACRMGIQALKKQIPKKPIPQVVKGGKRLIGNGWWCKGTTVYKCPCCNSWITQTYKYCIDCGQALDWSDSE